MAPSIPSEQFPDPRDGESGVPAPGVRGTALIVDDDAINLRLLSRMLREEGFATLAARSGEEAVRHFERERPDIVFMDVIMPNMSGIETTRRIKALAGDQLVPVIFLAALDDDDAMMDCIRAGGDDYLVKPLNPTLLKARILSMERARDAQRSIAADNLPLVELMERRQREQLLAERVFTRAIKNRNVATDRLGLIQRSAATFNGDLLLTQHLPDGGLRVLLADITGHGLGATIGALPVAEAFHAMTLKGIEDDELLAEINRKLHLLLPADRFMAACLVSISGNGQELRWWNGGMPSAWLRIREGLIELASHALPLGVLPALPDGDTSRRTQIAAGDGILMFTDGLLAARDQRGIPFGEARLRHLLDRWDHGQPVFPALADALEAHCGDVGQPDDIAALEIPINASLFAIPQPGVSSVPEGDWRWSVEWRDEPLAGPRSIESVLKPLGLMDGLEPQMEILETMVAELYAQVSRRGPDRATAYPNGGAGAERGGATAIRMEIWYTRLPVGGRLKVRVEGVADGAGEVAFATTGAETLRESEGMRRLRDVCESLNQAEAGYSVEAVYRWP